MSGVLSLFQNLGEYLINWQVMLAVFLATSLGIIIGALPGLTATMGIALLTGVTYGMNTGLAVPVLMGVYVGAIYGGSISAVLINIPGTGSAAATALDGHPLAAKGEAWLALSSTRFASFIGTLFGILCLAFFAPMISNLAEKSFASPEYFMLALFGILICGSLCSLDKPIKGWVAGFIGLMLSMVGMEEIHGYQRFVYGHANLIGGLAYVPAAKAAFLNSIYIIFVPILSWIVYKNRTSVFTWIGTVVAVIGLYYLCMTDSFSIAPGDLIILGATVFFALHITLIAKYVKEFVGVHFSIVEFITASILCLGYGFLFDPSAVNAQIVQCDIVYGQYIDFLFSGQADPEEILDEFSRRTGRMDDVRPRRACGRVLPRVRYSQILFRISCSSCTSRRT